MIKHVVMWKLKDFAAGRSKIENAEKIKVLLENLKQEIVGIKELEAGINIGNSDQSFDIALYSVFESEEALEAYQVHPKHREVGEFISEVRISRAVVDYIK